MIIFGIDIRVYYLLFMIFSIAGWCLEVTCKFFQYKRFINRGFLIGPYCPIYGYGGVLMTLTLKRYLNDPFVLFIMAILVCGTLEYLTSFFMEKIFHARWWDYSQRKFNLNGRVCAGTLIPFGIFGLIIMYLVDPFLIPWLEGLSELTLNISFWVLLSIYLLDNIVSSKVINNIKNTTKEVGVKEDNTEEITRKVKEILVQKSGLYRRLWDAFPKVQSVGLKIKEKQRELKREIKIKQRQLKKIQESQKN